MILGIYLLCLLLGGILIVSSILLGGHDQDADTHGEIGDAEAHAELGDAGADADAEAHVDAEAHDVGASGAAGGSWADGVLLLLSFRFWTFTLAAFGLCGLLLHVLGVSPILGIPVSTAVGLACGYGVAAMFRYLKRTTTGTALSARSLAGASGSVLLPVGPGKIGKVRLLTGGQDLDLPATTLDPELLAIRSEVLVLAVHDGVAEVTAMPRALAEPLAFPQAPSLHPSEKETKG
jgi:hypothetical protein